MPTKEATIVTPRKQILDSLDALEIAKQRCGRSALNKSSLGSSFQEQDRNSQDQSRVPLALLYDVHKDSADVLTALCRSRAPVKCAMKRSKRQLVMEDEPDIIDFKRIRLEADTHSDENGTSSLEHAAGESDVPHKPTPIQMQESARCTQCGQQLGPWHKLAGCWEDVRSGGPTIAAATLMLDVHADEDILMTDVNAANNQKGAFGSPVYAQPELLAQRPWN